MRTKWRTRRDFGMRTREHPIQVVDVVQRYHSAAVRVSLDHSTYFPTQSPHSTAPLGTMVVELQVLTVGLLQGIMRRQRKSKKSQMMNL